MMFICFWMAARSVSSASKRSSLTLTLKAKHSPQANARSATVTPVIVDREASGRSVAWGHMIVGWLENGAWRYGRQIRRQHTFLNNLCEYRPHVAPSKNKQNISANWWLHCKASLSRKLINFVNDFKGVGGQNTLLEIILTV